MTGRPPSPRPPVQHRTTRSYTCHGTSRSQHHHHFTPASSSLARPAPLRPSTLPLPLPPSPPPLAQRHVRHPALAHAHAQRAHNLGLLDTLDDETLAALANELREIGLGAARTRGARRAPVQVVQQAWGGDVPSGALAVVQQAGEPRVEWAAAANVVRRRSEAGALPARRVTADWHPLLSREVRAASPEPEDGRTPSPPPAYAPIDPLTHLPPMIFPLGTAHPSALNAPVPVRERESEGRMTPARSGAIRAERRGGRRWSEGTV
ncbi:hypothetical protein JCM10450v2_000992 [Rhodotorula kratochvilovae]